MYITAHEEYEIPVVHFFSSSSVYDTRYCSWNLRRLLPKLSTNSSVAPYKRAHQQGWRCSWPSKTLQMLGSVVPESKRAQKGLTYAEIEKNPWLSARISRGSTECSKRYQAFLFVVFPFAAGRGRRHYVYEWPRVKKASCASCVNWQGARTW